MLNSPFSVNYLMIYKVLLSFKSADAGDPNVEVVLAFEYTIKIAGFFDTIIFHFRVWKSLKMCIFLFFCLFVCLFSLLILGSVCYLL